MKLNFMLHLSRHLNFKIDMRKYKMNYEPKWNTGQEEKRDHRTIDPKEGLSPTGSCSIWEICVNRFFLAVTSSSRNDHITSSIHMYH